MGRGGTLATLLIKLGVDSSEVGPGLSKVNGQVQKASSGIGMAVGAASLAAVAGIGASIKIAADWETSMASVNRTMDTTGLSSEGAAQALDEIGDGLRKMAMVMPVARDDLAAIAATAGSLGVARDDTLDFVKAVALLAGTADDVTPDAAADAFGHLGVQLHLTKDDYIMLANTVSDLGNKGATTEGQILAMMNRMAGSGAMFRMSATQVAAWAAAQANAGLEAEMAGTQFGKLGTTIMGDLTKGGARAKALEQITGMTAESIKAMWEASPDQVMQRVITGLGGVGDEFKRLQLMDQAGFKGALTQRYFNALIASGDGFTETMGQAVTAAAENNAAQNEMDKKAGTTASKFMMLTTKISDMAITIGDALLPILIRIVDFISPIIEAVANWMSANQGLLNSLTPLLSVMVGILALKFGRQLAMSMIPGGGTIGMLKGAYTNVAKQGIGAGMVAGTKAAAASGEVATAAASAGGTIATGVGKGFKGKIGGILSGAMGALKGGGGMAIVGMGMSMIGGEVAGVDISKLGNMVSLIGTLGMLGGPVGLIAGSIAAVGLSIQGLADDTAKMNQTVTDQTGGFLAGFPTEAEVRKKIDGLKAFPDSLDMIQRSIYDASINGTGRAAVDKQIDTMESYIQNGGDVAARAAAAAVQKTNEAVAAAAAAKAGAVNVDTSGAEATGEKIGGAVGSGIKNGIRASAKGMGDAWEWATKPPKPKFQTYTSRLKQFKSTIGTIQKQMRAAMKHNDPFTYARLRTQLADAKGALTTFRNDATTVMNDPKWHKGPKKYIKSIRGITTSAKIAGKMQKANQQQIQNYLTSKTKKMGTTIAEEYGRLKIKTANASKETKRKITAAYNAMQKTTKTKSEAAATALPTALNAQVPVVDKSAIQLQSMVTSRISQLPGQTSAWGQHAGFNLASGLQSAQGVVAAAAGALAGTVHSILGFSSPPKKGPLSSIRQWGPHMVDTWASGAMGSMGAARKVGMTWAKSAAPGSIAGPSAGGAYHPAGSRPSVASWANGGASGGDTHIHIGTFIGDNQGVDRLAKKINRRKRLKTRDRRPHVQDPN